MYGYTLAAETVARDIILPASRKTEIPTIGSGPAPDAKNQDLLNATKIQRTGIHR